MRIPLDYYRILGLPLAASEEQLQQAYSDRILQLPRREYSQAAITSRKQLIEEAYVVLSDSKERSAYDKLYLAHAYDPDNVASGTVAVESLTNNGNLESQTLGIEISQEELVGALLLLQELGEYEQVLQLGCPYLINKNGATGGRSGNISASEEFQEAEGPDIILTVALACLELGREQWQQGHYENAAISLETGQDLLAKEALFPSVRAEIQADLYKLRPYRILELLALPEEKTAERRQGLDLLEANLDERGGIDGTFDDQSGLNIDDFLRFIQQLRNHLTVAEQHKLFETESKRPSAVATYLAVYALIARGFAQRQPALIRQAKQMLMRLGKRQDVHLEQSLCALLLGQTEEASRALELSQEYEALAFIRENSQDSPDLLPGLCLYGELWLQNDVFPHFRDLAKQQVSLKDYFANSQVQAYLEGLPTDAQTTNESAGINRQFSPSQQPISLTRRRSNSTEATRQLQQSKTPDPELQETPTPQKPEYRNFSSTSFPISASPATFSNGTETPVPLWAAEGTGKETNNHLNGKAKSAATPSTQKVRQRKRPQAGSPRHSLDPRQSVGQRRRNANTSEAKIRLLWMVFGSLAGILVLWLFVSTTFGLLKNLFSPRPSLQGKQLMVQLNDPVVPIPDPNSKVQSPKGSLTEETAEEVVQTWLATKAAALGVDHDIASLDQILAGTALSQWRLIAQQDKAGNRYRKYEHSVKVESVDTVQSDQNHASVQATVKELAQFYENGQINQKKSYNESVRVRYALVRQEGVWRIREMSVVNKISQNS